MYWRSRFCLLVVFLALVAAQKSKSKASDRPQGRTLGLLAPLLLSAGASPLYDVPVLPVGGTSGGGSGAGTQSDSYYGGAGVAGGGGYPGYGNYYGYGYPSLGLGYPSFGLGYPSYANYLGYPSYGYNRPNYSYNNYNRPNYNYNNYNRPNYNNYAGYQRPTQYPGSYNGYRPNYNNFNSYGSAGSYGNRPAAYPTPVSSSPGSGGTATGGAGSQLTTAQAAQIAGLLGQALGSSLRPLLANGGAGGAGGAGINAQALSNILSNLSG